EADLYRHRRHVAPPAGGACEPGSLYPEDRAGGAASGRGGCPNASGPRAECAAAGALWVQGADGRGRDATPRICAGEPGEFAGVGDASRLAELAQSDPRRYSTGAALRHVLRLDPAGANT